MIDNVAGQGYVGVNGDKLKLTGSAVESEELSELRYINYLTLLEEIEEQNYWERHSEY